MKFAGKNYLYLLIFGITLIGCLLLPNFKAKTEIYTDPQTAEVLYFTPDREDWIVINENALPNIPGRIYVLKTESRAEIWHTNAIARSENGELSERQKLNLLNTGAVPKGWKVVYVDEDGSPISAKR
ncbi:MAG: hypothetical protein OXI24_18510 [Candidatus Poribacteria bacterium]|nr:hypothetical protein [Candidatus Poribacteria bacterium]